MISQVGRVSNNTLDCTVVVLNTRKRPTLKLVRIIEMGKIRSKFDEDEFYFRIDTCFFFFRFITKPTRTLYSK